MEIHFNHSVDRAAGTPRPISKPAESTPVESNPVDFTKSAEIEQWVAQGEDLRPHVVERASVLAAQASYPPQETILKIASLLALNIES
jgi:hypothetical protein